MANRQGKRVLKRLASGVPGRRDSVRTVLNPPAGGTGATAGAYDTAINRDAMITCLTAVCNQLRDLGIIK